VKERKRMKRGPRRAIFLKEERDNFLREGGERVGRKEGAKKGRKKENFVSHFFFLFFIAKELFWRPPQACRGGADAGRRGREGEKRENGK
jgi:hypothetical protein